MITAAHPDDFPQPARGWSIGRAIGAAVFVYACWLGMLALHEFGHVLGAMVSRGRVVDVIIPLFGLSQTIVSPNPAERFVAWSGAHIGCAIPLLACGLSLVVSRRVPEALKFFTGFSLIANGAYFGLGWLFKGNDSADLVRLGTSPIALVAFGIAMTALGLAIWHRLAWLTWSARGR